MPGGAVRLDALGRCPFPMPPTLVVGVGYYFDRPEDRAQAWVLRVRDLTPCSDPLWEAQYPDRPDVRLGSEAVVRTKPGSGTPGRQFRVESAPLDHQPAPSMLRPPPLLDAPGR